MQTLNIHAAETQLSRLVEQAAAGEEIVIARAGKPVARLVRFDAAPPGARREPGCLAGQLTVPAGLDAPLPNDVLATFE